MTFYFLSTTLTYLFIQLYIIMKTDYVIIKYILGIRYRYKVIKPRIEKLTNTKTCFIIIIILSTYIGSLNI